MEENVHVRIATAKLLNVCDGAATEDGCGFNKFDAIFVNQIYPKKWSQKMCDTMKKILIKYRHQLKGFGINAESLDTTPEYTKSVDTLGTVHTIFSFKKDRIALKLNTDHPKFIEAKEKIKPFCWWNRDEYVWVCKNDNNKILKSVLKEYQNELVITPQAKETFEINIKEETLDTETIEMSNADTSSITGKHFDISKMYPFQKGGLEYALKVNNVLIADEMGLGKTIQGIAAVIESQKLPVLVICPASLKLNWKREVEKWTNYSVSVIDAETKKIEKTDFVIINYDILFKWMITEYQEKDKKRKLLKSSNAFQKLNFKSLIVDESHFCKNKNAKRSKAVKILSREVLTKVLLTGTPILNRPYELWEQLEILGASKKFGNFWKFATKYCGAVHNGFGWDFKGASNLEELDEKLRSICMVRRLKKNVLKDLPAKQRISVFLPMKNKKRYDNINLDITNWINEKYDDTDPEYYDKVIASENAEHLVKIEALKQVAVDEKFNSVIEWIDNWYDQNEGQKLVVFAHHKNVVARLKEVYKNKAVTLIGGIKQEDKQKAVDEFQTNPKVTMFIGNIQAAGVGITLTAASTTVFLELAWNPGMHDQAEDRIHRIGQENQVQIYYLLAADSIEVDIAELIDNKRKIVAKAVDGVKDVSVLKGILDKMRKQK
jgi:SWI/SNF-related matrix-associated actin-dependent regulator of chromatin subfamily A-like protein 1